MLETHDQRTKELKKQAQELINQMIYERGYKTGYETAKESIKTITESEVEEIKKIGREEAWETADKLNRLHMDEIREIFADDPLCDSMCREALFSCCTPELAIEKIKEYEQKKQEEEQEIRVGDEVYLCDSTDTRVVICIFEINEVTKVAQITSDGKWEVNYIRDLHKTGRHFDEIENVLEKLKEGE